MTSISTHGGNQRSEPPTIERLLTLRRPQDVSLSPDGHRVAYTVSPVAREKGNPLETRLWLGEIGGESRPIGEDGATNGVPRFSPDGRKLAFASDAGHHGRMGVRLFGGTEIGSIDGSVEDIRWSADNRSLLVLAADLGSHRAGAQNGTSIHEADADEDDPKVFRPAQHWRRLFLIDTETEQTAPVQLIGVNVFEFDWRGGDIVAVCTDDPSESAWYDAWLGLISPQAVTVKRVHAPTEQLQCPRISPRGRIAWIEGGASDRATVTGVVHVDGEGTLAPDLDATWIDFRDDESLWYAGWRGVHSTFGCLHLDGRVEERQGRRSGLLGTRYQPRVSPSADGTRVATVAESVDEPPEIIIFEDRDATPYTALNHDFASLLLTASWQEYEWRAPDGLGITGLLAVPTGAQHRRPLPVVVWVHGGPTAQWPWMFHTTPVLLAAEGYAVLLPNPRGSVGRGRDFARANMGDMGGADLRDILAGIDSLVRDNIADDRRIAITGGSYGGFMAAWAVTQTNRFAAAIPYAVCTNWVSFHLTTNIPRWDQLYLADDPYNPLGEYIKRSPVYHARHCTTPTLILQGEDDLCTPRGQALEFYNALVEAGCEAELVIYPREGHGWVEREHQIDAWHRTRDWLALHMS